MTVSLHETWLETVRRAPTAVAFIEGASGRSWTRRELAAAVSAWCEALPQGANLERESVVFSLPNGVEWLQVFLGVQALGGIAAPLDPAEPIEAQRNAAKAIGARWLWREGKLHDVRDQNPDPDAQKLSARPDVSGLNPPAIPPNACLFKLTSGSTGTPKALAFTHGQMLADGDQVCRTMDIRPEDLNLAVIPFGHSYGLGNLVVPLLAQGTALLGAASPLPHALAAECTRWGATVFPAVPALLRALVASDLEPAQLASIRVVISAGAPLGAEAASAFLAKFSRRIHNFYGSSETGGICYDRTGEATLTGRSVGQPLDGVTLEFTSDQRFTVASAAVSGNGRFLSTDRGELNADGELVLLGRTDRGVKISGRRLDLGEIENALRSIAGVRDAWVGPHPTRLESLAAAVATDLSAETIRRLLAQKIAGWKVPSRVMVMREFPLTARGKPDTSALKLLLGQK